MYIVKFWTCALLGSKFFQFHAVFGKIGQNHMLAPPGVLEPPPLGNPGKSFGSWRSTGKSWIRHWLRLTFSIVLRDGFSKGNSYYKEELLRQ